MTCQHLDSSTASRDGDNWVMRCEKHQCECVVTQIAPTRHRVCERCVDYRQGPSPESDQEHPIQHEPIGDHLHELLTKIGLQPTTNCQCEGRRLQMNAWGVSGCRERREEIVGWLREAGSQLSYGQQFAAFGSLASESWWSLTEPYGSIVDEAIRRAENPPL